jgi:hypothetical protein
MSNVNILRIEWRANKLIRCPICNSDHGCSATADDLHFCWRTHNDVPGWVYLGACRNGCGMFRDTGRRGGGPASRRPPSGRQAAHQTTHQGNGQAAADPPPPAVDCAAYLKQYQANARELRLLASALGASTEALRRLRVGYVPQEAEDAPDHWLFPERDGGGRIIGLLRRYLNGRKRQVAHTRRGLIYDPDRVPGAGELVLVVEGASDVAAGLTVGLCVVGRPNNLGGVEDLARLLGGVARQGAQVVVLGENDRKPSGVWPGKEGAEHVASELAAAWGLPVGWALPPEGVKDLRKWTAKLNVNPRNKASCDKAREEIARDCRTNLKPDGGGGGGKDSGGTAGGGNKRPARGATDSTRRRRGGVGGEKDCATFTAENLLRAGGPGEDPLGDYDRLGPSTRRVLAEGLTGAPCPRHYIPLLQGKSAPRKGLAVRVDCRRYGCPPCAARRRCYWLTHFMPLFAEHGRLHAWHGQQQGKGRPAPYWALRRCRADYASFSCPDAALVLATHALPGSEPVDVLGAVELAAQALLSLGAGSPRKPINTSRSWALRESRDKGDYVRRGAAPRGRFPLVVSRLRRERMNPAVQPTTRGARCDWMFPEGWPEERMEFYFDGLGAPPGPGEEGAGPAK